MFRLPLLIALLLALTVPATAKEKSDHKADDSSHKTYEHQRYDDHGTFTSAERNQIRSWLLEAERHDAAKHPTTTGLPPGLQKKVESGKPLPPGWQKKLARGGHLDDDYYTRGTLLPDELLRRLPPPRPGSEILRVEDQIILLDAATRTILDIFGLGGY
jgi:Ni/Co efflux regulator RcnB